MQKATSKGPGLLAELEEKLTADGNETDVVTEGFEGFPVVGEAYTSSRDGCIAGVFDDDDVMAGIIGMFYRYFEVIRDRVQSELKVSMPEWIKIVVEPSWEDTTFVVVYLTEHKVVVFDITVKAWHFGWINAADMADEMGEDYERMLEATRKALEVKGG